MNTLKISTLFLSLWGDYGYILFSYLSASLFVTRSSAFSAKSIHVSFSWLEKKKIIGKDRKRCSKNQSLLTCRTEKHCYFFLTLRIKFFANTSVILPSCFRFGGKPKEENRTGTHQGCSHQVMTALRMGPRLVMAQFAGLPRWHRGNQKPYANFCGVFLTLGTFSLAYLDGQDAIFLESTWREPSGCYLRITSDPEKEWHRGSNSGCYRVINVLGKKGTCSAFPQGLWSFKEC